MKQVLLGAVSLAVLLSTTSSAASITILNPSFQNPVQSPGGFTSNVITNWTIGGGSAAGVFFPTSSELAPPTDGNQVGYINAGNISQVLSATLTANTIYTLQTDFLARKDCCGFPGSELDLVAGSTTVGSATIGPLAAGAVQTSTVTFTALPGNPLLGQALEIVISMPSAGQIDFDNVRLDGSPTTSGSTPEPMSFVLVGAGLGAAAAARRFAARTR